MGGLRQNLLENDRLYKTNFSSTYEDDLHSGEQWIEKSVSSDCVQSFSVNITDADLSVTLSLTLSLTISITLIEPIWF